MHTSRHPILDAYGRIHPNERYPNGAVTHVTAPFCVETPMPFSSRRQSRWAFATRQSFARRWARMGVSGLPETKHGSHNQASHGRRGPRGQAALGAYRSARASGASIAEARAAARDVSANYATQQRLANIAQQLGGDISANHRRSLEAERSRLQSEMEQRAQRTPAAGHIAPLAPTVTGRQRESPLFDARWEAESRRRKAAFEAARAARAKAEADKEAFFRHQVGTPPPEPPKPVVVPRAVAPVLTSPSAPDTPARIAALEAATTRVTMPQPGWNAPISDKQASYLTSLATRAKANATPGSPQAKLAQAIIDRAQASNHQMTKWEASQLIDAMQEPKPLSTLLHAGITRIQQRRTGEASAPTRADALWALASVRGSLIALQLSADADAEGLPF